jgi:hypothetical protein
MSEQEFRTKMAQIRRRQQRGGLVRTIILLAALLALGVWFGLQTRPARVLSVTPALALDDRFMPVEAVESFSPDDTFFISVELRGYRPAMALWARWRYDGQVLRETQLMTEFTGDGFAGFVLDNTEPWPAGDYRVEILSFDEVLGEAEFRVEE